MQTNRSKKIKFIIIIFSVLLMVCSALISYILVRNNDDKIANLQSQIIKKQERIENIWQSSLSQDSRIDNAILIFLLSENNKKNYSKILNHYLDSDDISIDGLIKLLNQAKENRENVITIIDDLYGEKIIVENEIMKRSQENKFYTTIAIFLQLMGVVLITINRDLNIT